MQQKWVVVLRLAGMLFMAYYLYELFSLPKPSKLGYASFVAGMAIALVYQTRFPKKDS